MATADNYDVDEDTQRAFPPDEGIPEPEHGEGFIDRTIQKLEPIPVEIFVNQGVLPVKLIAADFGTGQTVIMPAGAFQARQLLPQSNKRKRAVINVQPGIAANVAGAVYIGSQQQMNASPAVAALTGYRLVNGSQLIVESKSEIWIAGDGVNSLTVVTWDERFQ